MVTFLDKCDLAVESRMRCGDDIPFDAPKSFCLAHGCCYIEPIDGEKQCYRPAIDGITSCSNAFESVVLAITLQRVYLNAFLRKKFPHFRFYRSLAFGVLPSLRQRKNL